MQDLLSRFAKAYKAYSRFLGDEAEKPHNEVDSDQYTGKRGIIRYVVLDCKAGGKCRACSRTRRRRG